VAAWERLIHTFGQRRQLPVLAKHVPTERPRLRNTAYEMVRARQVVTSRPAASVHNCAVFCKTWLQPH